MPITIIGYCGLTATTGQSMLTGCQQGKLGTDHFLLLATRDITKCRPVTAMTFRGVLVAFNITRIRYQKLAGVSCIKHL